jgi:hypothetical protein
LASTFEAGTLASPVELVGHAAFVGESQALTAVKGVGGAIAGAAGAVGDGVSGLFKPKKRGRHAAGGPQRELEAGADEAVTGE